MTPEAGQARGLPGLARPDLTMRDVDPGREARVCSGTEERRGEEKGSHWLLVAAAKTTKEGVGGQGSGTEPQHCS